MCHPVETVTDTKTEKDFECFHSKEATDVWGCRYISCDVKNLLHTKSSHYMSPNCYVWFLHVQVPVKMNLIYRQKKMKSVATGVPDRLREGQRRDGPFFSVFGSSLGFGSMFVICMSLPRVSVCVHVNVTKPFRSWFSPSTRISGIEPSSPNWDASDFTYWNCQPLSRFLIELKKMGMGEIDGSEYESKVLQICSAIFLHSKATNDKVIQIVY